jgi:uncharacterized protein (TIGR03067 family)
LRLIFKGSKLTFHPAERGYKEFTCSIDPTQKPKTFDMTHSEKPHKGTTKAGIYFLEGDSLKICFSEKDNKRPKELTAKARSGQLMYVLKRAKP